jgi:hypothetical protein
MIIRKNTFKKIIVKVHYLYLCLVYNILSSYSWLISREGYNRPFNKIPPGRVVSKRAHHVGPTSTRLTITKCEMLTHPLFGTSRINPILIVHVTFFFPLFIHFLLYIFPPILTFFSCISSHFIKSITNNNFKITSPFHFHGFSYQIFSLRLHHLWLVTPFLLTFPLFLQNFPNYDHHGIRTVWLRSKTYIIYHCKKTINHCN